MKVNDTNSGYSDGAEIQDVPPGYKRTEVGVIPEDWDVAEIDNICLKIQDGTHFSPKPGGNDRLYVTSRNIGKGILNISNAEHISEAEHHKIYVRCDTRRGDLLLTKDGANTGNTAINTLDEEISLLSSVAFLRFDHRRASEAFFLQWFLSGEGQFQIHNLMSGNAITRLTLAKIKIITVPIPPISEQRTIAKTLSDTDGLLGALDALIAKKRAIKQAAMQQLLTGKTRLPGYSGEWETLSIADIATAKTEKNFDGDSLPVLTCSKHLGFVDSLSYFKNQVFSNDLSTYKVIRRGEIGYPANHIEEGSIGLQDLYDTALLSPIYVIFAVVEDVNSFFLHRLLKLDSYRQKFKVATTSSVDRRGSLRWPAFSEINIRLPLLPEQTAIATVLSDMDTEITALEQRRDKTQQIKQGMMQQLLTGRIRLIKTQ